MEMVVDLKVVVERLNILTKLVAAGFLKGKTQREQIWLLSKTGLQSGEIAELIGTSPNTVSVELTAMRKAKKRLGRQSIKKGIER